MIPANQYLFAGAIFAGAIILIAPKYFGSIRMIEPAGGTHRQIALLVQSF